MIGKELLQEILTTIGEVVEIEQIGNTRISYKHELHDEIYQDSISVHYLAHRCKKWAWDKHFVTIRSGYAEFGAWSNLANDNSVAYSDIENPLTEPEAIFKAAEWVRNNVK